MGFAAFAVPIGEYGGFAGIARMDPCTATRENRHRIAFLPLLLVNHAHFAIEQVRGHHVRVATPEDPARPLGHLRGAIDALDSAGGWFSGYDGRDSAGGTGLRCAGWPLA